jgi:hypothetical protein
MMKIKNTLWCICYQLSQYFSGVLKNSRVTTTQVFSQGFVNIPTSTEICSNLRIFQNFTCKDIIVITKL